MTIGDLLAILGFPPIVGLYYGSLVLIVTRWTVGPEAALREAEKAAAYIGAGATIPSLVAFFAALALGR